MSVKFARTHSSWHGGSYNRAVEDIPGGMMVPTAAYHKYSNLPTQNTFLSKSDPSRWVWTADRCDGEAAVERYKTFYSY